MKVEQLIAQLDALQSSGAEFEAVLEAAVQGVHRLDRRFHWTGIYELFPDNVLRLGPFIGAPTEHVFIGVGKGVCGTAVAEKRNMNIPDVSRTPNYLACSSDTRSELVVLIRNGDTIYAQIDIDSHELAAFDPQAVAAVERVADWLARQYGARSTTPLRRQA
jgi:GAF domain-containing protein